MRDIEDSSSLSHFDSSITSYKIMNILKSGGNPICQRRVRAIQDCMNECHMMDLGFSGLKFTWSNKRDLGGLIQCKLDRC